MNQKDAYQGDEQQPVFLHEVKVNGHRLLKGMEATLDGGNGRNARRYRFEYAEELKSGEMMYYFFGPTRGKNQRYRWVREHAINTVHITTRGNVEE